jgi:hypothetical protein
MGQGCAGGSRWPLTEPLARRVTLPTDLFTSPVAASAAVTGLAWPAFGVFCGICKADVAARSLPRLSRHGDVRPITSYGSPIGRADYPR